jgi:transcriptional regulator with XRE-family HTH domain
MDRKQLADFLRVRRAALLPEHVGLPAGSRRRTPGLRRQEVAQLAGISIEYYTRLEQARGPKPSRQVLGALARALMLNRDERAHLYHLAEEAPDPAPPDRTVPTSAANLLAGFGDLPAYVVNAAYDMLAWNDMADVFMGGLSQSTPAERNVLRKTFGDRAPAVPTDDPCWDFVRACVADVRASLARNPNDRELRALVDELLRTSPEFGELWADHEVAVRRVTVKRVRHERFGPMTFDCQVLDLPDTGLRLIVYVPEPGSPTAAVFAELAEEVRETARAREIR